MAHRAIERFAAGLVMIFLHYFPGLTRCAMERFAVSHTIYFAVSYTNLLVLVVAIGAVASYDQIEK